jgi:hypothetical protein
MITPQGMIVGAAVLAAWLGQPTLAQSSNAADSKPVACGRYLVVIGGCNDCHTPGYGQVGGNVPEKQWLIGSGMGWRGPWGTTYASNLRLVIGKLTEDQWVKLARNSQFRPPMPWWALHSMTEPDLRALYQIVNYLGPAGETAPEFVPPGQEPQGPFIVIPGPPK